MNRREFLAGMGAAALPAPRKPNIVIILADDLGYGDLACYGGRNPTPHLDALARGGVRFTDFHSNGAVCSPTRAALMTGRYQQRCGITEVIAAAGPRDQGLDPAAQTAFPSLLRKAGYRTAMFGKWHLGYQPRFNPVHHGFDEFRGYVSGNVDYFSHVDQAGHADWWNGDRLAPEEGYTTELVTRHGVRFIESNRERPFLLYLAHEAVHYPYQGPDGKPQRVAGQAPPRDPKQDVAPVYRQMLGAMDSGVGRVMDTLRRLGLERDTFVFFFSDNGATQAGSNAPLRGFKSSVWEGGHRIPAIAYWPGRVPAGKVSAQTGIGMDLFATLLEISGAPAAPRKLDGTSLMPILTAETPRTLFWGHGPQRAVRDGDWKLVLMPEAEPFLANLRADPGERTNLAAAESARVARMREMLAAWERDVQ
ncbi:MAG: sulfatase-like hydrolase/transferase [Bryobacteraceae bacterium]